MSASVSDAFNQLNQFVHTRAFGDAAKSAGKSFVYSFALSTVFSGGNAVVGLVGGGIAATASVINSLVTPLFNQMLDGRPATWWQDATRCVIVFAVANCVLMAFTPYRIDVLFATCVSLLINESHYQMEDRRLTLERTFFAIA